MKTLLFVAAIPFILVAGLSGLGLIGLSVKPAVIAYPQAILLGLISGLSCVTAMVAVGFAAVLERIDWAVGEANGRGVRITESTPPRALPPALIGRPAPKAELDKDERLCPNCGFKGRTWGGSCRSCNWDFAAHRVIES